MASLVKVTIAGSALLRSGMMASGCCLGSRTTLAMRVLLQRSYIAGWQVLHAVDPVYCAVWAESARANPANRTRRRSIYLLVEAAAVRFLWDASTVETTLPSVRLT